MTLGQKLYSLRTKKSKDLSHEKLAYELEVSKTAIIKWESDKSKPSIDNLLKICDYFETDVYDLLGDVSNVNFSGAKFKGNSYAGYAQNFIVNNTTSPELVESIIINQKQISELIEKQNALYDKLMNNKS